MIRHCNASPRGTQTASCCTRPWPPPCPIRAIVWCIQKLYGLVLRKQTLIWCCFQKRQNHWESIFHVLSYFHKGFEVSNKDHYMLSTSVCEKNTFWNECYTNNNTLPKKMKRNEMSVDKLSSRDVVRLSEVRVATEKNKNSIYYFHDFHLTTRVVYVRILQCTLNSQYCASYNIHNMLKNLRGV